LTIPVLISLETARQLFFDLLKVMPAERVPLEQSGGRVLAEDIYAENDIPPFNRSPLDGYAFWAEDTRGATEEFPCWLQVLEEVPAGHWPKYPVSPGTATKILTGAPIPEGANAVIRFEDTLLEANKVGITRPFLPDSNICWAGEDIEKGERGLRQGNVITPGAAGMLASLGYTKPQVFCRPSVSIISTGDELVEIHQPLTPGKIRNSNLYSLMVAVQEAGGIPLNLGTVTDDPEMLGERLELALEQTDLVITTGGASVGDYDIVKDTFQKIGAKILFWKIGIRPGTAAVGAIKDGKALLGLSGNPGAASITFELLVRPLIRYLGGWEQLFRLTVEGIISEPFQKKSPQRRILRGIASWQDNLWQVKLAGKQNPGILRSLVACNALIDIPAGTGPLEAGNQVKIIIQGGWGG
jgi:molybdopterin molybdotransferase